MNTELRKKAKNAFEKDFFKLMNDSVFGKTIEQLRKRIDVRIVTRVEPAEKLVAKPNYESFVQINEDVVAVKLRPTSITWNKPTYVGFCMLELAKLHMYDFHYNVIKARYGNEVKLLFTDTDSLCYFVQTDDVYADMFEQREYYDTVDYPPNHFLHSSRNAKVLGKFKDECAGNPPIEFVGLCAKMYSLLTAPDTHKFAVKGVKTSYAKKKLRHETFLNCLRNNVTRDAEFKKIASAQHALHTVSVNKVALSPYDDKRYLLDGYGTLAYGHSKIGK